MSYLSKLLFSFFEKQVFAHNNWTSKLDEYGMEIKYILLMIEVTRQLSKRLPNVLET